MNANGKFSILFVCMGNICRSPTAEGIMRKLLDDAGLQNEVEVDSAGTHEYHIGAPPDTRSQVAAKARGYDLSALRARQICDRDFESHDLLLAMDMDNLMLLQERCPAEHQSKLRLLMSYAREIKASVVPDPYHLGPAGYGTVLDYIEDACNGLLLLLLYRRAVAA